MVAHSFNPSTGNAEVGGSEFKASSGRARGYVNPVLEKRKTKKLNKTRKLQGMGLLLKYASLFQTDAFQRVQKVLLEEPYCEKINPVLTNIFNFRTTSQFWGFFPHF